MALVDVLAYDLPDDETVYRAVEAGRASEVVAAHEDEYRKRRILLWALAGLVSAVMVGYSLLIVQRPLFGVSAALVVFGLVRYRSENRETLVPSVVAERIDRREAGETYGMDEVYDVEATPSGNRAGTRR